MKQSARFFRRTYRKLAVFLPMCLRGSTEGVKQGIKGMNHADVTNQRLKQAFSIQKMITKTPAMNRGEAQLFDSGNVCG